MPNDDSLQFLLSLATGQATDASPAGRTVTVHGCRVEQNHLVFAGVADYLELPALDADFSQGFTAEAWVSFGDLDTRWVRIFDLGNGENCDNIFLGRHDDQLDFLVVPHDVGMAVSASTPVDSWGHIAATVDSQGAGTIYWNGAAIQQANSGSPNNISRTRNYVGKSNTPGDRLFAGRMTGVRLYDRALTLGEIQADMEADCAPEIAAALDKLVFRVAAELGSLVVTSASPLACANRKVQVERNDLSFVPPSYLNFSDASLDFSQGITLEAWIRPSLKAYTSFIVKSWDLLNFGIKVDRAKGQVGLFCNSASCGGLALERWTHVAATLAPNGDTCLYVDGQSQPLTGQNVAPDNSGGKTGVRLSWGDVVSDFDGRMTGVRLYQRLLTADQIGRDLETDRIPEMALDYSLRLHLAAKDGSLVEKSAYHLSFDNYNVAFEKNCLVFAGAEAAVLKTSAELALDFAQGCSVEAWVLVSDPVHPNSILSRTGLFFSVSKDQLKFLGVRCPGPTRARWAHVAATAGADGRVILYVDGRSRATGTGTPAGNLASSSIYISGGDSLQDFRGKMTGVRLYDRVLSADEVRRDMEADRIPETAFDYSLQLDLAAAGGGIAELSPYRLAIVNANNGVTVDQGTLLFGPSQDLTLPAAKIDLAEGLTVEAWIRLATINGAATILSSGPSGNYFGLRQSVSKEIQLFYNGARCTGVAVKKWVHVAATVKPSGETLLFVNGGSRPVSGTQAPPVAIGSGLRLSWTDANHDFEGNLSGVRLYNRVLSHDEILEDMAADMLPPMAQDLAEALGAADLLPAIEASVPVDFKLHNQQGQAVLYTLLPTQPVTLELWNTSRGRIGFAPRATPTNLERQWLLDNHQLYLSFRPGTLLDAGQVKLDSKVWSMACDTQRKDQVTGFFLWVSATDAQALEPFQCLELKLENLHVDGRGGSRGTRVELTYQNLESPGSLKPLKGKRMHYLGVLDEKPPAALLAAFVGSDTFLNTGVETTCVLRLSNQSGGPLDFGADSKIKISVPKLSDAYPWGLADDPTKVAIEAGESFPKDWEVEPPQGEAIPDPAVWFVTTASTGSLAAGACFDLEMTVTAAAAAGPAFFEVHYEGFSGREGTVRVAAKRSPLVVKDHQVGIGILDPQASLHVAGPAQVDGKISGRGADFDGKVAIGRSEVPAGLEVTGDAKVDGRFLGDARFAGKVDIGTSEVPANLHVTGDAQVDGRFLGETRFAGKVDIGTSAKPASLLVAGDIETDGGSFVLSKGMELKSVEGKLQVRSDLGIEFYTGFLFQPARQGIVPPEKAAAYLDEAGTFHVTSLDANWSSPSDLRLKRGLRPLRSALAGIDQLNGVRFRWNEEGLAKLTRHLAPAADLVEKEKAALDVEQVGLIAQDVQAVLPEIVKADADGHLGVDYSRVVPLLVEAIKELKGRVEALESLVAG